ncbi:MAG: phosphatase PAP2 family protein [Pirellulales bacterium]
MRWHEGFAFGTLAFYEILTENSHPLQPPFPLESPQMNPFDHAITTFLNQFAHRSYLLDSGIQWVAGDTILKGCVVVASVWWAWFERDEERAVERRSRLIATLMACVVAVLLARGMALSLPFRHRPIHEPLLEFTPPYNVVPETLTGWSSFPSDHAVLFYGLATGVFLASRRLGLLMLVYVTCVIGFSRVYIGYHYPTDILAGALIGALAVGLANVRPLREPLTRPAMWWLDGHASSFYAALFLLTFQMADVFTSGRELAGAVFKALKEIVS